MRFTCNFYSFLEGTYYQKCYVHPLTVNCRSKLNIVRFHKLHLLFLREVIHIFSGNDDLLESVLHLLLLPETALHSILLTAGFMSNSSGKDPVLLLYL